MAYNNYGNLFLNRQGFPRPAALMTWGNSPTCSFCGPRHGSSHALDFGYYLLAALSRGLLAIRSLPQAAILTSRGPSTQQSLFMARVTFSCTLSA